MKIVVVTGKSGSGKTYISNKLAQALGCEALDLDQVSHQTLNIDTVKLFVKETFGESVFDGEQINTKALGKIAFSNPELLDKLNDICHQEMLKLIDTKLASTKTEFIVLDYLMLPKMKYFTDAHFKVLVEADLHTRKTRIISRDNITAEYFNTREANSIEFDPNQFDYVLHNSSTKNIDDLINQIKNRKN